MSRFQTLLTRSTLVFALGACAGSDAALAPGTSHDDRLSVLNDAPEFEGRVQYTGADTIQLQGESGTVARVAFASPGKSAAFIRSAVVSAPSLGGSGLLASHVIVRGAFAYVAYMTLGETARGAVEVFDVSRPDQPRLVSQLLLKDSDVHALATDGNDLLLATSTEDPAYNERAVLERITLSNGRLSTQSTRVQVPSYVATGVDVSSKYVFVTSGSGGPGTGGLTVLDRRTLARVSGDVFTDARAITGANGRYAGVSQGSPGRLRLYDPQSGAFLRSITLQGGTIPESKSAVALTDTWGFVATGDGGVQVVDLPRGVVAAVVPRPSIPGIPGTDLVTNAVTLADDFILAADGGAGVAVTWCDYKSTNSGQQPSLLPLGRLLLPGSANFVTAGNNAVFVAQGAAGMQVLSVVTN